MDKTRTTGAVFGTPKLRNATQSSGQRVNETVARPGGLTPASPEPSTESGDIASLPGKGQATRPSGYPNAQGTVKNQQAKGRSADSPPPAARPGGSTPSKGK
jgi:hypothetical protein